MRMISLETAIDEIAAYAKRLKEEKYHAGAKVIRECTRLLAELPEAKHGWISCDENLPEEGREVIVLTTFRTKRISIGRRVPKKNYWEWLDWPADWHPKNPTSFSTICPGNEYVMAWMPLPETQEDLR